MAFTFNEKYEELDPNATLIVDGLNLAFRWKHTAKYNTFRFEFLKTVESIAQSYGSSKIIVAADWGSSTYRKSIYPGYKADRQERYKDQTEAEKIKFEEFFDEYESTLKLVSDKFTLLRYKGVEADDIAAHLVINREKYELENIWLLSSDADWDLLVNEDSSRFSWRTRKEITLENWSDHYDVTPEQFISYKCLTGDKSDNIPGIAGIGPKRAATLLQQYDSIFDIYDAIPVPGKYKYLEALNEGGDILMINFELMDLPTYCDEAIGEENVRDICVKMGEVQW